MKKGFTLIELLIVIAILALIAVPNFLEAQVRAKVARAQSDLRTIATALEAYSVEWGAVPPMHDKSGTTWQYIGWAYAQRRLTTPIAYMNGLLPDVFQLSVEQLTASLRVGDHWIPGNPRDGGVNVSNPGFDPSGHQHVYDYEDFVSDSTFYTGARSDWPSRWFRSFGQTAWKIQSMGPSRSRATWGWVDTNDPNSRYPNMYYDSSNGTMSVGLITRTQAYAGQ